eukprot:COSAG03_NODE_218_length_10458_cov_7.740033_4_plen_146_part_00
MACTRPPALLSRRPPPVDPGSMQEGVSTVRQLESYDTPLSTLQCPGIAKLVCPGSQIADCHHAITPSDLGRLLAAQAGANAAALPVHWEGCVESSGCSRGGCESCRDVAGHDQGCAENAHRGAAACSQTSVCTGRGAQCPSAAPI